MPSVVVFGVRFLLRHSDRAVCVWLKFRYSYSDWGCLHGSLVTHTRDGGIEQKSYLVCGPDKGGRVRVRRAAYGISRQSNVMCARIF